MIESHITQQQECGDYLVQGCTPLTFRKFSLFPSKNLYFYCKKIVRWKNKALHLPLFKFYKYILSRSKIFWIPRSTYPMPDPIGSCKIRPSDKIRYHLTRTTLYIYWEKKRFISYCSWLSLEMRRATTILRKTFN